MIWGFKAKIYSGKAQKGMKRAQNSLGEEVHAPRASARPLGCSWRGRCFALVGSMQGAVSSQAARPSAFCPSPSCRNTSQTATPTVQGDYSRVTLLSSASNLYSCLSRHSLFMLASGLEVPQNYLFVVVLFCFIILFLGCSQMLWN